MIKELRKIDKARIEIVLESFSSQSLKSKENKILETGLTQNRSSSLL